MDTLAYDVSGFHKPYTPEQEAIAGMYKEYLRLMKLAEDSAESFKFHDGEQGVDKTRISENYRRLAAQKLSEWKNALAEYRRGASSFYIRRRWDGR